MEHTIENTSLIVKIKTKGAELFSIVNKDTKLEYMWSADAAFWGKSSPILFPIVGALQNNQYQYEGKNYSLPRHGFARDEDFEVENKAVDNITFLLRSTPASLEKYPFKFELRIHYRLEGNSVQTTYDVTNNEKEAMYFSIGGHPAFKVPLTTGARYEDYYLSFSQEETTGRWPISKDGLIEPSPEPFLDNTDRLPLTHELFFADALVLKNLESDKISIRTDKNKHGVEFHFPAFPFMGIWAAKNADFVCIEPWCGIADSVKHNQLLTMKEGIEKLPAGEAWSRTWSATCF